MERWRNGVAVVTGASAGIGAAVVKDLVRAGLNVVGLARRHERVEQLRVELPDNLQSRLHAVKCDVSDLQSVNQAFDWIEAQLGGVDILVNNAGILYSGQLLTLDPAQLQQVMQTNVMGLVYCAQRAFKSMRARNVDGHVILINSVAGHSVVGAPAGDMPVMNIYAASKYAVTALTETIRQELREFKTKIKVTSISPGVVDTDIVPNDYKSDCILKTEDISQAILYVLATPPHVQVHELIIKPVGEAFN